MHSPDNHASHVQDRERKRAYRDKIALFLSLCSKELKKSITILLVFFFWFFFWHSSRAKLEAQCPPNAKKKSNLIDNFWFALLTLSCTHDLNRREISRNVSSARQFVERAVLSRDFPRLWSSKNNQPVARRHMTSAGRKLFLLNHLQSRPFRNSRDT